MKTCLRAEEAAEEEASYAETTCAEQSQGRRFRNRGTVLEVTEKLTGPELVGTAELKYIDPPQKAIIYHW